MLTVLNYLQIRTAHSQGESIRSLSRRLHRSQKTIHKVIGSQTGEPAPYRRSGPTAYPKLGPYIDFIEQVLKDDQNAPLKQRHTAMQIYRRLKGSQFATPYSGEYNAVRRYVQRHRQFQAETFVPLTYQPGVRLECDFGHIHVDYPDGRKLVSVLVAAWSFSQALFLIKLPNEKTESVLAGITAALSFFGCAPRELWWDNPKTVAWGIHRGRERSLNAHFAALASHYRMEPLFCMPRKGQEKSDAERSVFALQRRFGTPVPAVADDVELNTHLRRFCEAELTRTVAGRSGTIGEEFAQEKAQGLPLPAHGFDACVSRPAVVDKYQTVRVDRCRYSVPRECAFRPVTVKLYPERLQIVHAGKVVAEHKRLAEAGASTLDPLHYLPTLLRSPPRWIMPMSLPHGNCRPASSSCGPPLSNATARPPARGITSGYCNCSCVIRSHGWSGPWKPAGKRPHLTAEMIAEKTLALAPTDGATGGEAQPAMPPGIPVVTVPPPDLRRFDELLSPSQLTEPVAQGESNYGLCLPIPISRTRDAAEMSSQDPAAADDAGGILQACA